MAGIRFDTGAEEYDINGRAVLRFNPTDPELYACILDFQEKEDEYEQRFAALQNDMTGETDEEGLPVGAAELVRAMRQLDGELKADLRRIFGEDNDFDAIFDHRNALALNTDGETILSGFLTAIAPYIKNDAGERTEVAAKLLEARKVAQANRAQRRAAARAAKGGQGGRR